MTGRAVRSAGARSGKAGSARGFTLVELMISLTLGLVVIGGVVSIMLANKRTYQSNEALSQIQESARTAFELVARDARQASASGCDNNGRIANVLTGGTAWWQAWFGIAGYEGTATDPAVTTGTATPNRITGTDSIQFQSIESAGLSVKTHNTTTAAITLNATATPYAVGDVLMVCDFDHAALFKVTAYDNTNFVVTHAASTGTPGNCSKGLGFPTNCTTANLYQFKPNSQVARFTATDWYIGNNGRPLEGGRSLYRMRLGAPSAEEVVAGVTDMQIRYRVANATDFVDATSVAAADWKNVNALAITLSMTSADQRVSTNASAASGRLQRSFTWLVTLRNRVP
jgi:type IV pilus assembly protein PilW